MSDESFEEPGNWNNHEEVLWNDFEMSSATDYSPASMLHPINQSTPQQQPQPPQMNNSPSTGEPLRKRRRLDFQLSCDSTEDVSQGSYTSMILMKKPMHNLQQLMVVHHNIAMLHNYLVQFAVNLAVWQDST